MNLIEQINTHKYLYLDKLVEINDLELEVWLKEARVADQGELPRNTTAFGAIVTDEKCKKYKLLFKNYINYSVLNESFSFLDEEEIFEGKIIRKYTKSKFINYVTTVASSGFLEIMNAERFIHIGICCLNHIVDVACLEEPIIEEIL